MVAWKITIAGKLSDIFSQLLNSITDSIRSAYAPWISPTDLIRSILAVSADDQERFVDLWLESKTAELTVVVVTAALVASTVAALFSWSWFPIPPWPAKVAEVFALLQAFTSITTAAQQIICLSRASLHPDRVSILVSVAAGGVPGDHGSVTDSSLLIQSFVWQVPTTLLGTSVMFALIGFLISIFDAAVKAGGEWEADEVKVAAFTAISMLFCISSYFLVWWRVERRLQTMFTVA